jgi:hypothetical protein
MAQVPSQTGDLSWTKIELKVLHGSNCMHLQAENKKAFKAETTGLGSAL